MDSSLYNSQSIQSRTFNQRKLSRHYLFYQSVRSIKTSQSLFDEKDTDKVTVHFKRPNGEVLTGTGKVGENLLDVVVNNNLDLDGFGACEGTLACSTCHLILKQEDYDSLKNPPTDEELDMLDLAYGLTDTSRLGCQVFLTKDLDGLEVDVPEGINDQRIET
jgi:ferredoxin